MTSPKDMRRCFDLVTVEPARILGLAGYGLTKGSTASLVVLDASDPVEAIRLRAARLAVVSKGKVVSRLRPPAAEIDLPGRPKTVDRRHTMAWKRD